MVLCWWCCHPFECEPFHMPYKYDDMRKKFYTTGIFCSWACTKAFALDKYGVNKGSIISQNIALYRKRSTDNLQPLTPAPNRYCLKCFGGTMDIDEFRNVSSDNYPRIREPNSIYLPCEVVTKSFIKEQQSTTTYKNSNIRDLRDKMSEINNSKTTTETLRLKRPKPLKRDKNNLESMLGITRTSSKK
jgi:hypothetical protein